MALALLVSIRDLDAPDDPGVLGESDLPLNLRRRLGLSSVILDQIRRYERQKGEVSATEVASLFELISRRPDATKIFMDAGRRIAEHDLGQRGLAARLGLRVMPQGLRRRRAWRRVRRIARGLSPSANVRVDRKPYTLVIERGLPAIAVEGGRGCAVLNGTIRSVFEEYRAGATDVVHTSCEGNADPRCAWQVGSANGGLGTGSTALENGGARTPDTSLSGLSADEEAQPGSDPAQPEPVASG